MTSASAKPAGYPKPSKDPGTAAMLSLIPGLGQFYNGQSRKGALFLGVDLINLLVFLLFVVNQPIVDGLVGFGQTFHMKVNPGLRYALMELRLWSAPSLILTGLMVAFIAYAMRDAYDHAAHVARRNLYPEYVMEMPEATSGSYLFHFVVIFLCFVLAFFFLIPPPPSRQVTDIEFVENQPEVKHKVEAKRRAQHNSEDAGKHEKKEVTPPSPAPAAPSKAQQAKPAQKQAQPVEKPQPQPHPTPHPTARPMPTPAPTPTPTPAPHPSPQPRTPSPTPSPTPHATPTPFVHPSASPSPNPSPSPAPSMVHASGSPSPAPMPKVGAGPGSGSAPGPAPAPVAIASGAAGGGNPSPEPMPTGGGARTKGGGSGPSPPGPAPSRASFSHGGGGGSSGPIAIAPALPRSSGGGAGEGARGNPDANSHPDGAPSVKAQADVDFGPYMADLQRRIKRQWFPPKGNESKRVVVIFKVHRDGQLSNLRLGTSSGVAIADKAALSAVENAAPFRRLPDGASDDVDIQFTFDYNVFAGGGHGSMRTF